MMGKSETTSNLCYDKIADTYTTIIDSSYVQYLKYVLVKKYSHPNRICLDAGIGNGVFAIPLASQFNMIYGIDINLKYIVDQDVNSDRGVNVSNDLITTDYKALINDKDIDIEKVFKIKKMLSNNIKFNILLFFDELKDNDNINKSILSNMNIFDASQILKSY